MKSERDDPLLEACLDEVLAGRTPPDLSARILQAHAARRSVDLSMLPPLLPGPPLALAAPGSVLTVAAAGSVIPPPIVANGRPLVELAPLRNPQRSSGVRQPSARQWPSAMIAASVIGLGLIVGAAWYAASGPQLANTQPPQKQPGAGLVKTSEPKRNAARPKESVPPAIASRRAPEDAIGSMPQVATSDNPPAAPAVPLVEPPQYADPSPDPEVISFVNASLARAWTENGVAPAPPATDAEWCRRLFVRVVGRIPTADELTAFTADRAADKREQLVDRLLTDENYVEEYSRHWATVWGNVLVGRTGGRGDSLASREGLDQYLRGSLAKNKPYNEVVRELLTATGSAKPGSEHYNGAVNFLLAGMNKDATLATARVARVFLGHQLQCAQCHNHPSQDWSQQQFWALNSFFRQMHSQRSGDSVQLANVDFGGQGRGSTEGEVYYETPAGLLKSALPAFLDGTTVPPSGELAQVDRRAELAKMVTASEQLPRALVNRMWSHFFGYGFTAPVDDMNPAGGSAHPEVLDRLADEFAARQYDLKSVIRWIALSDPFGRSSKLPSLLTKDMPEAGEVALFSRYYSRQLGAEEVYNSLVQAAQIRKAAAGGPEIEQARVDWLAQFNRPMGTDDADEESQFSGGIGQSLIMMNGDLMRQAASSQHAGLLRSVAQSKLTFEEKISHLFLSALSREPARRELEAARTVLAGSGGNQATALEDIWWALLNSNEFILDH